VPPEGGLPPVRRIPGRPAAAGSCPAPGPPAATIVEVAELRTARLLLRQWRAADLAPLAALNADPEVMRYLPSVLTPEASDALAVRAQAALAERGFGLWALEVERSGTFVGFVGLAEVRFAAPFTPATEIGWRLGRAHWGGGTRRRPPAPSSPSGSRSSRSSSSSPTRPSRTRARVA
jgi:hypothetical protein